MLSSPCRSPSPDLMSADMQQERERQAWERQVQQEVDKPVGPVHYQDIQQGEIRTHGVGYYAFSTDESKRIEQMDLLNKLREQVPTASDSASQLVHSSPPFSIFCLPSLPSPSLSTFPPPPPSPIDLPTEREASKAAGASEGNDGS